MDIRDIKKDLKRWGVLEDAYQMYEDNIKPEDQIWKCTVNDYLVQVWINLKMEVDKTPAKELLKLIPPQQHWFKKMLIKMMLGQKVYDFSKIADELRKCQPIQQPELDHLMRLYPRRIVPP